MSHPGLLVLSQHADRELPLAESGAVADHVAGCAACRAQLARMRSVIDAAIIGGHTAATAATALEATGARDRDATGPGQCPSPSLLSGWGDPALPATEHATLERHLAACDACLADVLAARRLLARIDATPALPVPRALRDRVASRWGAPLATASALTRLVVRVTRAGAELLESQLAAPLRDLIESAAPLPALRSATTTAATVRSFTLHGPDATIIASIVAEGDAVGLTLRLEDDGGEPLVDQRVFLRHRGRSLYSARTGSDGLLRMPGIEHGVYEVDCPGIATAFQLDLRA